MLMKKMLVAVDELLDSKNDVDIKKLIDDLVVEEHERAEISIMVKLLFNDKLNLNTTTRYAYNFGGGFVQYDYLQHSYIKNIVRVKTIRYSYEESTDNYEMTDTYNTTMDIEAWDNMSTDYNETLAKAKEVYNRTKNKK